MPGDDALSGRANPRGDVARGLPGSPPVSQHEAAPIIEPSTTLGTRLQQVRRPVLTTGRARNMMVAHSVHRQKNVSNDRLAEK